MSFEFTKELIDKYLSDTSSKNIEFEDSMLETLIRDGVYDLVEYSLDRGFNRSKLFKLSIKHGTVEWFDKHIYFVNLKDYTGISLSEDRLVSCFDVVYETSLSSIFKWASNNRELTVHMATVLSKNWPYDKWFMLGFAGIFLTFLTIEEISSIEPRLLKDSYFTRAEAIKYGRIDILNKFIGISPIINLKNILGFSLFLRAKEVFLFYLQEYTQKFYSPGITIIEVFLPKEMDFLQTISLPENISLRLERKDCAVLAFA